MEQIIQAAHNGGFLTGSAINGQMDRQRQTLAKGQCGDHVTAPRLLPDNAGCNAMPENIQSSGTGQINISFPVQ